MSSRCFARSPSSYLNMAGPVSKSVRSSQISAPYSQYPHFFELISSRNQSRSMLKQTSLTKFECILPRFRKTSLCANHHGGRRWTFLIICSLFHENPCRNNQDRIFSDFKFTNYREYDQLSNAYFRICNNVINHAFYQRLLGSLPTNLQNFELADDLFIENMLVVRSNKKAIFVSKYLYFGVF
jgi:hypothetical protein